MSRLQFVRCKKSFPDQLVIHYRLRKPIARMHSESMAQLSGGSFLDSEGKLFNLGEGEPSNNSLPDLTVETPEGLPIAAHFLQLWNPEISLELKDNPFPKIKKISVDSWEEITFFIGSGSDEKQISKIVWGNFIPKDFQEKLKRFQQVGLDLKAKSLMVQYINLRDALHRQVLPTGDRERVGQVFVRPLSSDPLQIKFETGKK